MPRPSSQAIFPHLQTKEAERLKQERIAKYTEKKAKSKSQMTSDRDQNPLLFSIWFSILFYSTEPQLIAKSNIILDIKPVGYMCCNLAVFVCLFVFVFTFACYCYSLCKIYIDKWTEWSLIWSFIVQVIRIRSIITDRHQTTQSPLTN